MSIGIKLSSFKVYFIIINFLTSSTVTTVIKDATKSMICYYDQKRECNEGVDFHLNWVVDVNISCFVQSKEIHQYDLSDVEICKEICIKTSNCESFTLTGQKCLLYNYLLHCVNEKISNFEMTRWYRGCCKELIIHVYEQRKFEKTELPVQCHAPTFGTKATEVNYLYLGSDTNGHKCQRWDRTLTDVDHSFFPDKRNDHNYCRNLNLDSNGPWCITSGRSTIQFCKDVKPCLFLDILDAKETDICYQNSKERRQTKCSSYDHTVKFIIERQVSCVNVFLKHTLYMVVGLVDCKELCLSMDNCVSALYQIGEDVGDGKPFNQCKISTEFHICQKQPDGFLTHLWIGCCRELRLPDIKVMEAKEKRICMESHSDQRTFSYYIGSVNVTIYKKTCLHWSNVKRHDLTIYKIPHGDNEHNYCRNLNNDEIGPWCFTSGQTAYEYCKVPYCSEQTLSKCPVPSWFISFFGISWIITIICLVTMVYLNYLRQEYILTVSSSKQLTILSPNSAAEIFSHHNSSSSSDDRNIVEYQSSATTVEDIDNEN